MVCVVVVVGWRCFCVVVIACGGDFCVVFVGGGGVVALHFFLDCCKKKGST